MLKIPCYIEDRKAVTYIAVSESGRLSMRVQNPFQSIPEIEDFEDVLKSRLQTEPDNTALSELIEAVHAHNESSADYERARFIKTLTPRLAQGIFNAVRSCDARDMVRTQNSFNTTLEGGVTVIKAERDVQ